MDIEWLKLEHEGKLIWRPCGCKLGACRRERGRARQAADIYTELSLAALISDEPRTVATTAVASSALLPASTPAPAVASPTLLPTSTPAPATPQTQPGGNFGGDLKKVLLIGDSHLRYASRPCVERGAIVDCCPGARTENVKSRLLNYVNLDLSVVYIHVGCNNLRRGYRGGGPGYNGGHGKREALHSMADLLYTARTIFQNSKIVLNSILIRRDIGNRALCDFNSQLELMCNNFRVEFVEVNNCVGGRDLARDGTHLNRGGASRLGSLMLDVVSQYLAQLAPTSPPQTATSVAPTPETGESSGTRAVGGCPDDLGRPGVVDTSRLSGNLHVGGGSSELRVVHLNMRPLNTGFSEMGSAPMQMMPMGRKEAVV
ncbi:hypothetical protein J6590_020657 [Homalodisca vitripennis]|nr:hypothetical protein J6590_020657 [Homalodisca vitripennis]